MMINIISKYNIYNRKAFEFLVSNSRKIFSYLLDNRLWGSQGVEPDNSNWAFLNYSRDYNNKVDQSSLSKRLRYWSSNCDSFDIYNNRIGRLQSLLGLEDYIYYEGFDVVLKLSLCNTFYRYGSLVIGIDQPNIESVDHFLMDVYLATGGNKNELKYEENEIIDVARDLNVFCYLTMIDKQNFLQWCSAAKKHYKNSTVTDIVKSVIWNFNYIRGYRQFEALEYLHKFIHIINKSMKQEKFSIISNKYISTNERRTYRNFIQFIINNLKSRGTLENLDDNYHNPVKVDILTDKDQGLHPDLAAFFYIMNRHNKLNNLRLERKLDSLKMLLSDMGGLGAVQPLREAIKEAEEHYSEIFKLNGYIMLYGMENMLGYRYDPVNEIEMSKQWKMNFEGDTQLFEESQVKFFHKYFKEYVEYQFNTGKSVVNVLKNNINRKYAQGVPLVKNKHLFFNADGATHIKDAESTKKHNMSKTQYFASISDIDSLFSDKVGIVTPDNNTIVVKHEGVKHRIVVNTTVNTYIPLNKIVNALEYFFGGILNVYPLMSKKDKMSMYARYSRYVSYNKYIKNRFVLLPLDYSSFDTTISFGLIKETILAFGSLTPISDKFKIWMSEFENILKNEKIIFREFNKSWKYKYGMLSGWKITNIVESLLNNVISFGIARKLGYKIVDLMTMGDDLIMVFDSRTKTGGKLDRIKVNISEAYGEIGFKVHPIKNIVTYNCCEFLRNYYGPGTVFGYPIRSWIGVIFVKPTSELEYNNYTNYCSSLDKLIMKNGYYSIKDKIYQLMNNSTNSNIKRYGYRYTYKPEKFRLISKRQYIYKYTGDVKKSHLYDYYNNLVNDPDLVAKYLRYFVFSKSVEFERIEPRMESRKNIHRISKLVKIVKSVVFSKIDLYSRINLGDYFLEDMLCKINEKDYNRARQILLNIIRNIPDYDLEKKSRYLMTYEMINNRSKLKLAITDIKVPVIYDYYCNMSAKIVKDKFRSVILSLKMSDRRNIFTLDLSFYLFKVLLGRIIYSMSQLYIYTGTYSVPIFLYCD